MRIYAAYATIQMKSMIQDNADSKKQVQAAAQGMKAESIQVMGYAPTRKNIFILNHIVYIYIYYSK